MLRCGVQFKGPVTASTAGSTGMGGGYMTLDTADEAVIQGLSQNVAIKPTMSGAARLATFMGAMVLNSMPCEVNVMSRLRRPACSTSRRCVPGRVAGVSTSGRRSWPGCRCYSHRAHLHSTRVNPSGVRLIVIVRWRIRVVRPLVWVCVVTVIGD